MKYLADDGTIFENKNDCENYEHNLKMMKVNKRRFDMVYGEFFTGVSCFVDLFDVNEYSDLLAIKDFYETNNNVPELYGFDEAELEDLTTTNKYPFTAVVLCREYDWAEILLADKAEFIKNIENFAKMLKEN